jgi:hypothetical protein
MQAGSSCVLIGREWSVPKNLEVKMEDRCDGELNKENGEGTADQGKKNKKDT